MQKNVNRSIFITLQNTQSKWVKVLVCCFSESQCPPLDATWVMLHIKRDLLKLHPTSQKRLYIQKGLGKCLTAETTNGWPRQIYPGKTASLSMVKTRLSMRKQNLNNIYLEIQPYRRYQKEHSNPNTVIPHQQNQKHGNTHTHTHHQHQNRNYQSLVINISQHQGLNFQVKRHRQNGCEKNILHSTPYNKQTSTTKIDITLE